MMTTSEPSPERLVLIVDDDEDIRDCLSLVLESRGFHTVTAEHGKAALEAMTGEKPDVVLADLMMPVMSGAELAATMKQDPRLSDVPVLLVTAWPANAGQLGAQEVVAKPINVDRLLDAIRKYCH